MLRHWTQSSKVSCLVITCAALPKNDDERFREDNKVGWSSRVLYKYAQALDIDMNYLLAYEPLVRHSYGLPNETLAMIDPFLSDLRSSGLALQYLMELYIFLVTSGFYDARGRVAVRNCVDILQLSREEYFALEVALARSLHDCEERLARAASAEINKDNTKLKRYLKIGAAGLGAGAVIALTGGLAAPAVAAALVVIGGSAAAAAAGFATFTVLASVFGTAGAGLAGYKMARRTKGIDEFEFEQFGEKGQLAVTIMVSGWMHESEDYKRTFGILPSAMTLEEALTRFYLQHDRGMLNSVKSETSAYEKSPMALVDQVTMKYGLCPLTPANLTTPYDPIALSERDQALLERLIADFVMTGRSRPFDGHWSSKDETDSDNATTKTKSSISNSAGRFFKGLMPGSASVPLPSEKNTKSQISSICQSEERDNANNTNINCAYDVTALKKPTLSRSQSITSGTPDVGVHLLESHQITEVSPVAEDRKCGITSEMEVGDPIAGYVDRSKDCRIGDHSNFRLSSNEMKSNDAKEGPELHYWDWTELEVAPLYELYLLKWETATQMEIGTSLKQLLKSLKTAVAEKMLMLTVAGLVMSAVALPYTLLKLTDLIDNTWVISLERADAAGKELAEALLNRPQGSRPVTLVGHSIGARLIFSCLAELAKRRESDEKAEMASTSILESEMKPPCEEDDDDVDWASTGASNNPFPVAATAAVKMSGNTTAVCDGKTNSSLEDEKKVHGKTMSSYGLIQDVVLLGVPVNTSKKAFSRARRIVTGRFINGYSTKDLCLAFLYRWGAKEAIKVAGLQEVCVEGVENIDLSFLIEKHTDYSAKMKHVLNIIDFGRSSGVIEV